MKRFILVRLKCQLIRAAIILIKSKRLYRNIINVDAKRFSSLVISSLGVIALNRRQFVGNSIVGAAAILMFKSFPALSQDAVYDRMFTLVDRIYKNKMEKAPIGDLIAFIGLNLIDTPYVGGTLDNNPVEKCVVNWHGLDCVTFFENCLDLARIVKKGSKSADDLIAEITFTRYRDGKLDGYLSRLHYTADWIANNEKKNVVENITKKLGGIVFPLKLDFMSKNFNLYPALKSNKDEVSKVIEIEEKINELKRYYIPSNKVKNIESKIKSGDIIAIATSKAGLDYSHTGLAYRDEKKTLRFLHASSKLKKVTLDQRLSDYLSGNRSTIGVTIVRPKEV